MPSQSNALLVVGDSNVGMCKNLFDATGELIDYDTVDFWYETGSAFNTVRINDGWISSSRQDGLPAVHLQRYDHILFAGGRLRVMPVFEQIMTATPSSYSSQFIISAVDSYLNILPGFRRLSEIRDQHQGRITAITTPLRGAETGEHEGIDCDEREAEETYELIWDAYRQSFRKIGVDLLAVPFSVIRNGYLVDPKYNLAEDDDLHKNMDYAHLVLSQRKSVPLNR